MWSTFEIEQETRAPAHNAERGKYEKYTAIKSDEVSFSGSFSWNNNKGGAVRMEKQRAAGKAACEPIAAALMIRKGSECRYEQGRLLRLEKKGFGLVVNYLCAGSERLTEV
jgi:hypothetical protein